MAYFDRFDICEAHLAIEQDYNVGGWLRERATNVRLKRATSMQLKLLGFNARPSLNGFKSLTENGQEIYRELQARYGFTVACECVPTEIKGVLRDHGDDCCNAHPEQWE